MKSCSGLSLTADTVLTEARLSTRKMSNTEFAYCTMWYLVYCNNCLSKVKHPDVLFTKVLRGFQNQLNVLNWYFRKVLSFKDSQISHTTFQVEIWN